MKEQSIDQSILAAKVNQASTLADENSYYSIEPIHSLSQSHLKPLKYKKSAVKPAFGTTSIRDIKQLNGNHLTDVVAYSRINYQKNQKYNDRYQQVQTKSTPFLVTSPRFSNNNKFNPGPGTYKFPEIFKNETEIKRNQSAMFCPFKRWQVEQRKLTGKSYEIQKDLQFKKSKESLQKLNKDIQQKVKQKREEMKRKMLQLKEIMKKPQPQFKPDLKRMGYRVEEKNEIEPKIEKNQHERQEERKKFVVPDLKEITSKYFPKKEYQFEREEFRTGSEYKNYLEKYNNQHIFMKGNQNLYSSYISPSETPGPGYYEKRTKKIIPKIDLKNYGKIRL